MTAFRFHNLSYDYITEAGNVYVLKKKCQDIRVPFAKIDDADFCLTVSTAISRPFGKLSWLSYSGDRPFS